MKKVGSVLKHTFILSQFLFIASASEAECLPVKIPPYPPKKTKVRNKITLKQLLNLVVDSDKKGFYIDLEDPTLYGYIYYGPYPFEAGTKPGCADYDYFRFRKKAKIIAGKAFINVKKLFKDRYNANNWSKGQGFSGTPAIGYRLDLFKITKKGFDYLGFYDGIIHFKYENGKFVKLPTIYEGPFVTNVTSDHYDKLNIIFKTDKVCKGIVLVEGVGAFKEEKAGKFHNIPIKDLNPAETYKYVVKCGDTITRVYKFETAPRPGELDRDGVIKIAFAGDSREGVGGGERNFAGVNKKVLSWIAQDAYRKGADFIIFGGDLVNGYTDDPEDFELQLFAWKQSVSGYWRSHPVYTGMGNHEALLKCYDDGSKYGVCLDKFPYNKYSAEIKFKENFYNFENGPTPSDPRRPTYRENVYSFKYGPVMVISFNNNYWWTTNKRVKDFGGSPEGYILEDQLKWIEEKLKEAENDPTVKYVILFAQEPVFPAGGHVKDAMWYYGNNSVRAYTYKNGKVIPEKLGIIEVRNRLWKAISNCSKVAAVLGADEHEYYRILITNKTPVDPVCKNIDKHTKSKKCFAPNPDFKYPTWFITAGTAGAPYYSRQWTPWEPVVLSSQSGYLLLEADNNKISIKFISTTGQIVDKIDDLMSVKNNVK